MYLDFIIRELLTCEGRGGYDPHGKAFDKTLVLSSGASARHNHLGPPQSRRIRVLTFADVLFTQSLQLAPPSFDLQIRMYARLER